MTTNQSSLLHSSSTQLLPLKKRLKHRVPKSGPRKNKVKSYLLAKFEKRLECEKLQKFRKHAEETGCQNRPLWLQAEFGREPSRDLLLVLLHPAGCGRWPGLRSTTGNTHYIEGRHNL